MRPFYIASDEDEGLHASAFMEGLPNLSLDERFCSPKAELFRRMWTSSKWLLPCSSFSAFCSMCKFMFGVETSCFEEVDLILRLFTLRVMWQRNIWDVLLIQGQT